MKNLFKILFLSLKEDKKMPTTAIYSKRYVVGIRPQTRLKNEITKGVYNK